MNNYELLINELRKLPTETAWVEFKSNNYNPEMIGKDISALANAAAFHEKNCAYMVWGIDDCTHQIIGTTFKPDISKKGNEELENWLRHQLSDNADFEFISLNIENKSVVLLIIYRAANRTVMFEKTDYIRIGSYTKRLNEYQTVKTTLWDKLRNTHFELLAAHSDLTISTVLNLLNVDVYFENKNVPKPTTEEAVAHYLLEERIIIRQDNGLYAITNLGALLFAKRIEEFPNIARKAIRVVQYQGLNKYEILKEYLGNKGYAVGFEGLLTFISALLPTKESINGAIRKTEVAYPFIAIREAVANALIHQDLTVTGTGPTIEIFDNRIEITNPGIPLIDIQRIIDNPPRSRNERLANLMRRMGMCEELGSGWDKIAISCEVEQLPAPRIDLYLENTKVTLFRYIPFSSLSMEDKLRSCYFHACLKYLEGSQMTNSSLRNRFGLDAKASAAISRLIKDAVSANLIKPFDPETAPRYMKYIPIWA